jgi:hypothetical protein
VLEEMEEEYDKHRAALRDVARDASITVSA